MRSIGVGIIVWEFSFTLRRGIRRQWLWVLQNLLCLIHRFEFHSLLLVSVNLLARLSYQRFSSFIFRLKGLADQITTVSERSHSTDPILERIKSLKIVCPFAVICAIVCSAFFNWFNLTFFNCSQGQFWRQLHRRRVAWLTFWLGSRHLHLEPVS